MNDRIVLLELAEARDEMAGGAALRAECRDLRRAENLIRGNDVEPFVGQAKALREIADENRLRRLLAFQREAAARRCEVELVMREQFFQPVRLAARRRNRRRGK